MSTSRLTVGDFELHQQLGITAACLAQFQVHRVDDREARELLCLNGRPGRLDGIVYPYVDPVGGHTVTRRLRRDQCEYENGKPKATYVSAYGDNRHADRDQLFAEAAAREAAGASIRVSPTLWTAAGEQQECRRAEDPWELILEPLLDGDGITHVEHVAVEAMWDKLKVEANHRDNRHADRVAAIVQRFGFAKKIRKRVDGEPTLCWVRADAEDEYL